MDATDSKEMAIVLKGIAIYGSLDTAKAAFESASRINLEELNSVDESLQRVFDSAFEVFGEVEAAKNGLAVAATMC
jgi:hypothetical protein